MPQTPHIVTGASENGTWVRLISLPIGGKFMHGFGGVDVGDRIHVRLDSIDVNRRILILVGSAHPGKCGVGIKHSEQKGVDHDGK